MYIANEMFGIGEIISQDAKFSMVFFEDSNKTKKLISSLLITYSTEEAAEEALNAMLDVTAQKEEAEALESKRIIANGVAARHRLEEDTIARNRKMWSIR